MWWIKSLIFSGIPNYVMNQIPNCLPYPPLVIFSHEHQGSRRAIQTCVPQASPRSVANSTPTPHFGLSRAAPRRPPAMPHIAYVILAAMPPPASAPISSMRSSWSIPGAWRAHHRERPTMANWRQKSTHGLCGTYGFEYDTVRGMYGCDMHNVCGPENRALQCPRQSARRFPGLRALFMPSTTCAVCSSSVHNGRSPIPRHAWWRPM
jgi:hypothetical protein